MRFETRSEDTVENARDATPMLERERARRVLVLTTMVVHANGGVDNHAQRALGDFREARRERDGRYRLGAVACPFVDGGPAWSEFE